MKYRRTSSARLVKRRIQPRTRALSQAQMRGDLAVYHRKHSEGRDRVRCLTM